jgi:hypothetical protein
MDMRQADTRARQPNTDTAQPDTECYKPNSEGKDKRLLLEKLK